MNSTFFFAMLLVTLIIGIAIGYNAKRNTSTTYSRSAAESEDSDSEDEQPLAQSQYPQKANRTRKNVAWSLVITLCVAAGYMIYSGAIVTKPGLAIAYSAAQVLPTTTLKITNENETELRGTIRFFEQTLTPKHITFDWQSIRNNNDAMVRFIATEIPVTYESVFNGFAGFQIETNTLAKPNTIDATDAELNILLYKIDATDAPHTITVKPDEDIAAEDEDLLKNLIRGYIGEYFVQLSIKLGSIKKIGADNKVVIGIHQYARFLYSLTSASMEGTTGWRWNTIDDAVHQANKVLAQSLDSQREPRPAQKPFNSEDVKKRRLQLESSCTAPWHWIGDGYCDSSANNAACNWDNGDCCEKTCDDAVNWEDNEGTDYSGYECGVAGYNCVPGCNVAIPSYLGDGYCDKSGGYNTAACGYDLGDCCEDTCHDNTYSCGSNGYQCYDPSPNWCSRTRDSGCDNDCIGLCGADCSCWSWTCGDCHCHGECGEHDTYCSCDSYLAFWCVNVFWVNCDNGDSAVFR